MPRCFCSSTYCQKLFSPLNKIFLFFSAGQNNLHSFTASLPTAGVEGAPASGVCIYMCCCSSPWHTQNMPLITEHRQVWKGKREHIIGDSLSLRRCLEGHGRRSLQCDWLSPLSRLVTADVSTAQQRASSLEGSSLSGNAAMAQGRPWLGIDDVALFYCTVWKSASGLWSQIAQLKRHWSSRRYRSLLSSGSSCAKANLPKPNSSECQGLPCSQVFKRLALHTSSLCSFTVSIQVYLGLFPTSLPNRTRGLSGIPPTLIRGKSGQEAMFSCCRQVQRAGAVLWPQPRMVGSPPRRRSFRVAAMPALCFAFCSESVMCAAPCKARGLKISLQSA